MAKSQFFVALSIFLFIFNLAPSSYALYGSSSPVVQLNPSNFKSKVNQILNFSFFFIAPVRDPTVLATLCKWVLRKIVKFCIFLLEIHLGYYAFDSEYLIRVALEFLLLLHRDAFIFLDHCV